MRKDICKIFLSLVLAIHIFLATPLFAEAAVTEVNLFNNPKVQNITITVSFEVNDIKVSFISPSGKVYDIANPSKDMDVMSSDTVIFVAIRDAAAGQWRIKYDKGSNEKINVKAAPMENPIWITEVKLSPVDGYTLPVEFFVSQENSSIRYEYTVNLATDRDFGATKELIKGTAKVNETVKVELNLSDVNSHDEYYIQVYARYTVGDSEYFDVAYSNSFSYQNLESVEGISDYDVTVNESLRNVTVKFDGHVSYRVSEVYAKVYEDSNEILSSGYDKNEDLFIFKYSETSKQLKISLYAVYSNGRMSEPNDKVINIERGSGEFTVDIGESGLTNTSTLVLKYKNADNQKITTKLNDGKTETIVLIGDGKKVINLPKTENEFFVAYTDASGIVYEKNVYVNVDTIAPDLEIFEPIDGITTSAQTLIITGKTTGAESVSVNGNAVELLNGGTFKITYSLIEGKNLIAIKSTDTAGNSVLYQAEVIYLSAGSDMIVDADGNIKEVSTVTDYIFIIIAGVVSVAGIVGFIAFNCHKKKLANLKAEGKDVRSSKFKIVKISGIVLTALSYATMITSIVFYIIRYNFINGEDFIRLAGESIIKADEYVAATDTLYTLMITFIIVSIVLTLALILVIFIGKRLGNKSKQKAEPVVYNVDSQGFSNVNVDQNSVFEVKSFEIDENAAQYTQTEDKSDEKSCPCCGSFVSAGAHFCTKCGTKLE